MNKTNRAAKKNRMLIARLSAALLDAFEDGNLPMQADLLVRLGQAQQVGR